VVVVVVVAKAAAVHLIALMRFASRLPRGRPYPQRRALPAAALAGTHAVAVSAPRSVSFWKQGVLFPPLAREVRLPRKELVAARALLVRVQNSRNRQNVSDAFSRAASFVNEGATALQCVCCLVRVRGSPHTKPTGRRVNSPGLSKDK
jgi:hypothetical protein